MLLDDDPRAPVDATRAQAAHRVTEPININDLTEIVRPVRPARRRGDRLPARRCSAAGKPGSHACEPVAAMKRRGYRLHGRRQRPPLRPAGTTDDDLEQTVVRPDVPAAVRPQGAGTARRADAGIDHTQEHAATREFRRIGSEQICGRPRMIRRCVRYERDDIDIRRSAAQDGRDLGDVRAATAVIGEQENDVSALALLSGVWQRTTDAIADDDWPAPARFIGKPSDPRIAIDSAAQAPKLRPRRKQVRSCAGGQRARSERNAT
ncbi:hypothetical protein DF3PA_110063 [Candidatus Defluviicoccus seviourii]|uniref:Uncharacterized protein n=1 Tax=Candidatus Defluviicoccus seviourii TaxID=2565273 RepID=A0A564WAM6_9PROT|nr:hypothetical protein DF3PA_110063 [Candidatus Defluviicoccus seviourii]